MGYSLPRRIGFIYDSASPIRNDLTRKVGIFRKDLMKFIAFAKKKFDIVIYSLAMSDLTIYQAVTIEMYYNFVYAVKKDLKRRKYLIIINNSAIRRSYEIVL